MAFYIESRFVDIRTLVDFSEFNEADFYEPVVIDTPIKADASALPIQTQESLDNSQALEQVTKIIIESETKTTDTNSVLQNEVTIPISANEPVLELKPSEETKMSLPAPKVEIVDKTELYAKYINQKYEKETAVEFIKLLLNPFIIILAYRYEFLETSDNSFSINLRHLKNVADKELPNSTDDTEVSVKRDFQTNLLEYNRKKELERKMSRK